MNNDLKLFLKYNNIHTKDMKKSDIIQAIKEGTFKNKNDKIYKDLKWSILLSGTYNCNANCIYCENHKLRENYNNMIMSEDTARAVVRKLGPQIKTIIWHGGESLLLPESLLASITDERDKLGYTFKIATQTNGILLTEEKEQFLKEHDIQVGASFDGLHNTEQRGAKSTEGIMALLARHNLNKIGFINVVTKDSINQLIENYEYLKSIGASSCQTNLVKENVIEATNPYLIDNDTAIEKMIEYLKYWIYDTQNPIVDTYLTRSLERLLGTNGWCETIKCIGKWLVIDPYGNISLCGMFPMENNFGNINQIYSYKDILENDFYIRTTASQRSLINHSCKDCDFLQCCYGGCMGLNYEQNHEYKQLNERYCDYTKRYLLQVYELIKDLDLTNLDQYNPMFLDILFRNNYFSLTEIKQIEEETNA